MATNGMSFDYMMELQPDSSPLKALSRLHSPVPAASIPSLPGSPSPAAANTAPPRRKRAAEDMSQFAAEVSRSHKLVKTDHDKLTGFSKLGRAEQTITLMGHILALGHHQRLLQPAEVAWAVPKRLQCKIDNNAAFLMADPSIPGYRDEKIGPAKLLMDLVLASSDWEFTTQMKADQEAMDAITSAISKALISKRSTVKTAILSSLGSAPVGGATSRPGALDIVELSQLILTKLKMLKRIKVDLCLCGRMAVLRKLISEKNDNKYWSDVDKKLVSVRQKQPDPKSQSKWIKQHMLEPNLLRYKHVELKDLVAGLGVPSVPVAGPSRLQPRDDGSDSDI
ncbi:hypothetical protein B0H17DRAFT_1143578 [Mycena rosella]|uniref:Uncharacterized protein n=1 Tax=Mycena rosella TaxID=1033263 RepID=A0AAD7CVB3_MYCRO|nr:hypothetical protein B0H17DRAFT_1143578 [Mycena rosella]